MATCGTNLVAAGTSLQRLNCVKTVTKQSVGSLKIIRGQLSGIVYSRRIGSNFKPETSYKRARIMASSTSEIEKQGIKIVNNPTESNLSEIGVRSWPKIYRSSSVNFFLWGCPPSKFPWTYSSTETCYLLKGKVKVYLDGSDEVVEIGAGDLVVFPKGLSCTWDVSEAVDKHYKFD